MGQTQLHIRALRHQKGWPLTRVCQLTGIESNTLSKLERGLLPPYPGWRKRLAEAFGVPQDELFREEGSGDGQ